MNTIKNLVTCLVLAGSAMLAQPAAAHRDAYSDGEIDRMLAPVALYPDTVLSHVLIAATYPDEIREAAAWSRKHPDLAGEDAVDAVERQDWDPSVKALVAFPELLARMDEDPEWTEHLGDAFLKQEGGVMDRVQYLRDRAYDAGHLDSLEHVRVIREREYIYIEPAVARVVYVPYYDPWYVYGPWWWSSYPPYCWRTWYGRPATYYHTGFHWGVGFRVRPAFYFTTFHWPQRYVVIAHDHRRPIYSSREVARHQDVRRWHHSNERVDRRREHREATAGSPRRDVRTDARDNRSTDRRQPRGQADDGGRRGGDRAVARPERPAPVAERSERGRRSDDVRAQLRERRGTPRSDSPRAERRDDAPRPERGNADVGRERRGDERSADAPGRERRDSAEPRSAGRERAVETPRGQGDRGQERRGDREDDAEARGKGRGATRGNRQGNQDNGRERRGQRER